jgi:hypothetical protein
MLIVVFQVVMPCSYVGILSTGKIQIAFILQLCESLSLSGITIFTSKFKLSLVWMRQTASCNCCSCCWVVTLEPVYMHTHTYGYIFSSTYAPHIDGFPYRSELWTVMCNIFRQNSYLSGCDAENYFHISYEKKWKFISSVLGYYKCNVYHSEGCCFVLH